MFPTAGSAGSESESRGGDSAFGGGVASAGATSLAGTGGTETGSGGEVSTGGFGTAGASETAGSGGATAAGGTAGMGSGSAGAASGAGAGGTNAGLDYSMWQLQLPIGPQGNPTSVSGSALSKYGPTPYFFLAADGGRVFMDPKVGSTTNGSQHCRSEMRELNSSGNATSWSSSGTNTMTVTGKVLMLSGSKTGSGSVTIAQVFVDGLNTLAELQYNGSTMKVFYEEEKGVPLGTTDLKTPIAPNTPYKFVITFSKGVLSIAINDKPAQWSRTPSSTVSGKKFYFKVGNYDQTSTQGTPSTSP